MTASSCRLYNNHVRPARLLERSPGMDKKQTLSARSVCLGFVSESPDLLVQLLLIVAKRMQHVGCNIVMGT